MIDLPRGLLSNWVCLLSFLNHFAGVVDPLGCEMPLVKKVGVPTEHEYRGWRYVLPTHEYKWIPEPEWYTTKATASERKLVDKYCLLIYNAVKYITNREDRKSIVLAMVPLSEMPYMGFRQHIITRFYQTARDLGAK